MAIEDEGVQIPVTWVGIDDVPVYTVNQILIQNTSPEEFVLSFGEMSPPLLLGSDEEKRHQLQNLSFVPVRPVVRLGMTRQRIDELRVVLDNHVKQFEQRDQDE